MAKFCPRSCWMPHIRFSCNQNIGEALTQTKKTHSLMFWLQENLIWMKEVGNWTEVNTYWRLGAKVRLILELLMTSYFFVHCVWNIKKITLLIGTNLETNIATLYPKIIFYFFQLFFEKLTCNTCLRNSGSECITKSPWFVRHVRQFSL